MELLMNLLKATIIAVSVFIPLTGSAGPFDEETIIGTEAIHVNSPLAKPTGSGQSPVPGADGTQSDKIRTSFEKFRDASWFKKLMEKKSGSSFFFGKRNTTIPFGSDGFLVFTKDGMKRAAIYRYSKLTPDERQILEASSQEISTPEGKKVISGKELFAYLATRDPDSLQGFLNVCAKLRSPAYTFEVDGKPRTALSYVMNVVDFSRDRFRAESDPLLKKLMDADRKFSKVSGHGERFPDSWKQKDAVRGGGQISFSPDGTKIDADVDMFNIVRGGKNPFKRIAGIFGHIGEVLMPGKTDPYKVHNLLVRQKSAPSGIILDLPKDSKSLEKLISENQ